MKAATSSEILQAGAAHGVAAAAVLMADDAYLLPSRAWITTVFAPAWARTKLLLGTTEYRVDSNDCDDYARLCAGYAQLLNNRTLREYGGSEASLAFGEFWYASATLGSHAINAFLYRDDAKRIQFGFFEPQTGEILALSPAEVGSCYLLRL